MNAPDRFELFVLPDGVKKLTITPDTKIPNAATFKVEKEDHTLANMLRMQLLEDPKVLFAGYKMPHPLDHYFILKVQTTPDTTPAHVLGNALTELIQNVGSMKNKFEVRDWTRFPLKSNGSTSMRRFSATFRTTVHNLLIFFPTRWS
ncbi:DNA-directed RNA polymerase [Gamsiella multidivaricata]|uniref:DNA-directed RNA polymerase n=1 Tax=Gamsiella multidivaricata TaxID=101098 RepID=UPI002221172E|nr:DNA-directed RNA polymerase [Gamsiella multidivaricata]KAI7817175.1 DNA-directed RNA polymerase [Gamsiella multidivaricata]